MPPFLRLRHGLSDLPEALTVGTREDALCEPLEECPQVAPESKAARRLLPGEVTGEPLALGGIEGGSPDATIEGPSSIEEEALRTRWGRTDPPTLQGRQRRGLAQ